jgi:hypothetical protein
MSDSALPPRARTAGRVTAWALAAVLVAAVLALAWVGVRGWLAYGHLAQAQRTASALIAEFDGDVDLGPRIRALADDTAAARSLTDDVVWRSLEALPWVGPQLGAVSTVAAAADDVARDALAPIVGDAGAFSAGTLAPVDGRIDTAAIAEMHDAAHRAATAVARAAASVRSLPSVPLVAPLRSAVAELSAQLDEAAAATDALSRASTLLPAMLGADGPRDYLVLFQNNAEWRSLGGIPGAMALVHTDDGRMSLAAQESTTDFPRYPESVLPLSLEMDALFGQRPGQYIQNVTQVPDFTVTGALAREMWARTHAGQQIDGVLSIDPVALSYLLRATGPVTLPTGDALTADGAVALLLNEVYVRYAKPADQDAFFAAAAASVFDALADGRADPRALLTALGRAGDERRLLLWSAHADDQDVLARTTLAGGLPETDAAASVFGVYLNDGTGSKMDYYLDAQTAVSWDACTLDARGRASGRATLTLTLTSTAPADAASLPAYITGGAHYGVPAGTARTTGYVYLPTGFTLAAASSTADLPFGGGFHDGRRAVAFEVDLAPGASVSVSVSATTPAPSAPTLSAQTTPGARADMSTPPTAVCTPS